MPGGKTMRRSRVSRNKTAKAKLAPKTKAAVTQIATRVINRRSETKYVANWLSPPPEGSNVPPPIAVYGDTIPGGGAPPQLYDMVPFLEQSSVTTNDYTRIGSRVTPVKHRVDLDIRFNNTITDVSKAAGLDVCSWDVTAYIWYGYVKRYKNGTDVLANKSDLLVQLLKDGQGDTEHWNGQPYDDLAIMNNEVFSGMKLKKVRMYKAFGDPNTATVAGGVTTYYPATIRKRLSLTFKPPKTLDYDEGEQIPQNYAPIMIIGYQHNDNTQASNTLYNAGTPTALNSPALIFNAKLHLWFKDM